MPKQKVNLSVLYKKYLINIDSGEKEIKKTIEVIIK